MKKVLKQILTVVLVSSSLFAFENNTDRPGGDYKTIENLNVQQCENACNTEAACQAWTFVKPNTIQGPKSKCYLKRSVPNKVHNLACQSGVADRAVLTMDEVKRVIASDGIYIRFYKGSRLLKSHDRLEKVAQLIKQINNAKLYISIVRKKGGLAKKRVESMKSDLAYYGLSPTSYHVQRVSKKDKDRGWLSKNNHLWIRVANKN